MPLQKIVNNVYVDVTPEEEAEWAAMNEARDLDFSMIRVERNAQLSVSDWTRLDDAALSGHTAEEWATYRQALRDYPSQSDKVSTLPEWPEDPPTKRTARKVAAGQAAHSSSIEGGGTEEEAQTAYDTAYAATD